MKKLIITLTLALIVIANIHVGTVVETYDDTMVVETQGSTQYYTYDGMTDQEKNATHVVIVGTQPVVYLA